MKKTNKYLSLILALTLLAGCGSSGQAAAPEESTAANTLEAVEETAVPEIPEKPEMPDEEEEPVYDFDPETNYLAEIGDYTIEIPKSWINMDPTYIHSGSDAVRFLIFKNISLREPITEGQLFGTEGDYFIEQDLVAFSEYEIVERKLVSYNGIKMLYEQAHVDFDSGSETRYYYLFLNPSDSNPLMIDFEEYDDKQISLIGDIKAMLKTLKLKEE